MEKITELKVIARLIDGDKGIAVLEKCFSLVEDKKEKEEEQVPAKTIDETITEFLREVEEKAKEAGRMVDKEALTEAAISTILFVVKPTQPELSLDIPVKKPKPEEKKDADPETRT